MLVFLLITATRRGDLFIYEAGAKDIFAGKNTYCMTYAEGFHYYYSVLFAILIYPFTLLPFYVGNLLWLCLNAVLLYRSIILIARYFKDISFTSRQRNIIILLAFVFAARFLLSNFHTMQITICILYLTLEGLQLVFSGNKWAGALFIALGINIKILPVVFLPYLLYRREFRASFLIVFFYAAMLYLPAFIFGFAENNILISTWWSLINPADKVHNLDVDERSFQSLSTLLATLLVKNVPDKFAMPIRRNIMDISYDHLVLVLNIVRLLLSSFVLYFLRTKPFVSRVSNMHRFVEISYLFLLIPLIFPHQQDYEFLFIMPAVCYIIYHLVMQRNSISPVRFKVLTGFTILSYLICNLSLLFGEFRDYYEHFKILTYGALLVIPLLAFCYPLKGKSPVE